MHQQRGACYIEVLLFYLNAFCLSDVMNINSWKHLLTTSRPKRLFIGRDHFQSDWFYRLECQSRMFDLLLLSGNFLEPTLRPVILFHLGGVARQQLYFLPMFHALLEPYQIICFRQLLRVSVQHRQDGRVWPGWSAL